MLHSVLRVCTVALTICALPVVQAQEKSATPDKALQAFKAAVEAGDVKRLSQHLAGEQGAALRKLVEPFEKAKTASERFDRALKERKIDFKNPFAAAFSPLADMQFDVVNDEVVKKTDREYLARIKYGPRGKAQEETVLVQAEEGAWRVGAPIELAKTLPGKDRLERQMKGLEKLAEILDKLAGELETKKLTTKEELGVRLIKLIEDEKLAELLQ